MKGERYHHQQLFFRELGASGCLRVSSRGKKNIYDGRSLLLVDRFSNRNEFERRNEFIALFTIINKLLRLTARVEKDFLLIELFPHPTTSAEELDDNNVAEKFENVHGPSRKSARCVNEQRAELELCFY